MNIPIKNIYKSATGIGRKASQHAAFFPALLTLLLVTFVAFSINGSSIGIYHKIFYGNAHDSRQLINEPLPIRSDEWVVGTEKTIGQSNNNYQIVNKNVGLGENQSILIGAPTTDWSTLFHPDNFGFFVLPLDNAIALKWWLPTYLLALTVYFFVLIFLPKKRLLASIITLGFLFSPFLQWWGAYGSIVWPLLGFVAFTKLLHERRMMFEVLWGSLFSYAAVCFALTLYPPFQIPTILVVIALAIGYVIDHFTDITRKDLVRKGFVVGVAGLAAVAIFLLFMASHKSVTDIIQGTVYPGHRVATSGGYSLPHLLASQTSGLLQSNSRAVAYQLSPNQSEASNFMLIMPYLVIPLAYVIWVGFKKKRHMTYSLLLPVLVGVLLLAWLFVPGLDFLGKITFLSMVPPERVVIGLGILNLICLVLFIKLYDETRWRPKHASIIIYSLLVVIAVLCINFYISLKMPTYMGFKWAVILSLPFAVIIYFLLRKQYVIAMIVLFVFSFLSTCRIQPLYIGTSVIRNSDISKAMVETSTRYGLDQRWVGDYIILENFPAMNGLPSLGGTYVYPQLDIWAKLNQPNKVSVYNRYAHTNFSFDRNPATQITPVLTNPGADQMNIRIEPCDPFFKTMDVGYLLTTVKFTTDEAGCLTLVRTVAYPSVVFYIYRLSL